MWPLPAATTRAPGLISYPISGQYWVRVDWTSGFSRETIEVQCAVSHDADFDRVPTVRRYTL